jgi:hypothetical protein
MSGPVAPQWQHLLRAEVKGRRWNIHPLSVEPSASRRARGPGLESVSPSGPASAGVGAWRRNA